MFESGGRCFDVCHSPEPLGNPANWIASTEITVMNNSKSTSRQVRGIVAGTLVLGCSLFTGCQMDIAGQTLPSPYYLTDDVQYYAPASEFKLAKEAAALKQQSEAVASSRQSK